MSTEELQLNNREFFAFFYSQSATTLYPVLREKYKQYRQQGYNSPKPIREVNFVRKFETVCNYICFVVQTRAQKTDISLIQSVMQSIYDDYQQFFTQGGWMVVKNRQLKCHLQEHLLLRLAGLFGQNRGYGSLDRFVLCFFYTLNYFKTCNYEIRLFNEFLLGHFGLDYFFIFILLRKRSRRVNRDLVIHNEDVGSFIRIIKSEQKHVGSLMSVEGEEEGLGEIKLLLIYSQIIEYVQQHEVVLHEVMIFNLMRSVGLGQEYEVLVTEGRTNWKEFISLHFKQLCRAAEGSYQQVLLRELVETNLKLAERVITESTERVLVESRETFGKSEKQPIGESEEREKFLQESFGYLIAVMDGIIYGRGEVSQCLRSMYESCSVIHEYDIGLVKKLLRSIFRDDKFYEIYRRYLPEK